MKKPVLFTEVAYVLGLVLLALGTAMTAFGGFGMSMVVAPAYVLHLKLNTRLPWFSFGVAEYVLQLLVLLTMMLIIGKTKTRFFLSFAVAVVYGFLLDGATLLVQLLPDAFFVRLGVYAVGVLLCTLALSLLFHAYLPLTVYELFVKEVAGRFGMDVTIMKTVYDCASLVLAVVMSFALLGKLQGIGVGTVVCALCYGMLIRWFSALTEKHFSFENRFSLKKESEKLL